jgi:hypothetical protein
MQVNHKDTNRSNNALTNLEYVTPAGNVEHAKRWGRYLKGESSPAAKLNELEVRAIRALRTCDWTYKMLAQSFDVSAWTASAICRKRMWAHV